jgi:hypothetical protein
MRATCIIRHHEIALAGSPAARLVDALGHSCGNPIDNHQQAMSETWAFRDSIELLPGVIFAFRPTMFSIAICSRSSPTQLDVHVESSRADICAVSESVVARVSEALPPGRITYDVTLAEDDGKETGIRGKDVTFAGLLREQVHEFKLVPIGITAAAGFITMSIFTKNAAASATTSAVALAMLLIFIVLSSWYKRMRSRRAIKWRFEENVMI